MKRKLSLSALVLLGALPLGAIAAESTQPASTGNPPTKEKVGEYIDDAAVTTKVKAAFVKDKEVKAIDVKVETTNGVVQLSGAAKSNAEIERAVQLANNVQGVKSVHNDIRLK